MKNENSFSSRMCKCAKKITSVWCCLRTNTIQGDFFKKFGSAERGRMNSQFQNSHSGTTGRWFVNPKIQRNYLPLKPV